MQFPTPASPERQWLWLPKLPLAAGGWTYAVKILQDNAVTWYPFSEYSLQVNGVHFYCDQAVLQEWISLLEPS